MSAGTVSPFDGDYDGALDSQARELRKACLIKAQELFALLETTVEHYEPGSCAHDALERMDAVIGMLEPDDEDDDEEREGPAGSGCVLSWPGGGVRP